MTCARVALVGSALVPLPETQASYGKLQKTAGILMGQLCQGAVAGKSEGDFSKAC